MYSCTADRTEIISKRPGVTNVDPAKSKGTVKLYNRHRVRGQLLKNQPISTTQTPETRLPNPFMGHHALKHAIHNSPPTPLCSPTPKACPSLISIKAHPAIYKPTSYLYQTKIRHSPQMQSSASPRTYSPAQDLLPIDPSPSPLPAARRIPAERRRR
jgi:hypothetical protein